MNFAPFSYLQQPAFFGTTITIPYNNTGSYLLMGTFTTYTNINTYPSFFYVTNPSGSLSSSLFDIGTGFDGPTVAAVSQSDGKVIVTGAFSSYNGTSAQNLVRLNTNGTLDTAFSASLGRAYTGSSIFGTLVQPLDQKIIVYGGFTSGSQNYVRTSGIGRINTDGTQDTTFNNNVRNRYGIVYGVTIQPDNKLILTGTFTYSGSFGRLVTGSGIVRLNTNGTIDTTFNVGSGSSGGTLYQSALYNDGGVLVVGGITTFSGSTGFTGTRGGIVKLNASGAADNSSAWSTGNGFAGNQALTVYIQPNQKALLGSSNQSYYSQSSFVNNGNFATVNTNGSLDTTFKIGNGFLNYGGVSVTGVTNIQRYSDTKVLVTGNFTAYSGSVANSIAIIDNSGSLDTSFTLTDGFFPNTTVPNTAKILVTPSYTLIPTVTTNPRLGGMTIIGPSGSTLPTNTVFNYQTGVTSTGQIQSAVRQTDGKVLVAGSFTSIKGSLMKGVARFDPTGGFDYAFSSSINTPSWTSLSATYVTQRTDDSLLMGGAFSFSSGSARANKLAKMNTSGALDAYFCNNFGANNAVNAVGQQLDGKLVLGGVFSSAANLPNNTYLVRLHPNGMADLAFSSSIALSLNANITTIAIQPDQKILIGGTFTSVTSSGVPKLINRIARLNTDGTLDTAFSASIGAGLNNTPNAIALQSDGKILVGGTFTAFSGSTVNRLVRLNTDGTKDNTFFTGSGGFQSTVFTVLQDETDGKILVGGLFSTVYGNTTYPRLVRLNLDGTIDTTLTSPQLNNAVYSIITGSFSTASLLVTTSSFVPGYSIYLNPETYPGTGTTWPDSSGNGYDATLSGSITYTSGSTPYFTLSSSQYMTVPGFPNTGNDTLSGSFTLSIWCFPTAPSNFAATQGLWEKDQVARMMLFATSSIRSRVGVQANSGSSGTYYEPYNNLTTISSSYGTGSWRNLVYTVDAASGTFNYYQDGYILQSWPGYTASTGITQNTNPLGIANVDQNYAGRIGIAMVYNNKALSSAEILQNYKTVKGTYGY